MKTMNYERLSDLAIWFSVQSGVSNEDVMVVVVNNEIHFKAVSGNTEYVLKVVGDKVTYCTKTDVSSI